MSYKHETRLHVQSELARRGWSKAAQVIIEFFDALENSDEYKATQARIADLEARCAKYEADSMRLDKLQESFIKGEEFHIVLCEGKNDDEDCEHDTHPHFEAFDWSWRGEPARASTLRDVIDKALAEGGEHD